VPCCLVYESFSYGMSFKLKCTQLTKMKTGEKNISHHRQKPWCTMFKFKAFIGECNISIYTRNSCAITLRTWNKKYYPLANRAHTFFMLVVVHSRICTKNARKSGHLWKWSIMRELQFYLVITNMGGLMSIPDWRSILLIKFGICLKTLTLASSMSEEILLDTAHVNT